MMQEEDRRTPGEYSAEHEAKGRQLAIRHAAAVPVISAEQLQYVGRYANAAVMSAFEMIGGVQRLAMWADANPTDFFTKLLPKSMTRATQVDVSGTLSIDDAISTLERNNQRRLEHVQDAEFTPVYDL